jgi:hypothetical protein
VHLAFGLILFAALITLLLGTYFSTDRDVAYRDVDPTSALCGFDLARESDIHGRIAAMLKPRPTEPSWTLLARYRNDEEQLIQQERTTDWLSKLRCSLQNHSIPRADGKPLQYYLSFIEFRESGAPYPLNASPGQPFTPAELANRVNFVDPLRNDPIIQLRALSSHLRAHVEHNYVIVWVHGWRHDARIGDGNVRDLRVYAAHLAKWLAERCEAGETDHCDRVVTAVYIGWRGARLDENKIKYPFNAIANRCRNSGDRSINRDCWGASFSELGQIVANTTAAITLFDRKPVSEAIAPHVLTTLRSIEAALDLDEREKRRLVKNKLIVFGHSLGGNLLMTALKEDILKRINNHVDGTYYDSIIGNLIVLVNPASEAGKWTAIQKALWYEIPFRAIEEGVHTVDSGRKLFPPHQRPVLISVTSAFAWPPGGLRVEDCAAFDRPEGDFRDQETARSDKLAERREDLRNLHRAVLDAQRKHAAGVNYDEATYELFPLFKFDLRPFADRLLRSAARSSEEWCGEGPTREQSASRRSGLFAEFIRDLPFQNTDLEDTRTIGHLDPPRYSQGDLTARWLSAKPFGTTHEIIAVSDTAEFPIAYEMVAKRAPQCSSSRYWLSRAQRERKKDFGKYWDSENLAAPLGWHPETGGSPAVRFFHGPSLAGIEPIARPTDPFWNIRASDDVLSRHDGYMLPSFICAFNQLVIDDITEWPEPYQN